MSSHAYNRQRTHLPVYLYRAYNRRDRLLYIGITTSVKRRVAEHNRPGSWWRREVVRVESELVGPMPLARAVEAAALRREAPRRNGILSQYPGKAASGLQSWMAENDLSAEALAERMEVDLPTVQSWMGVAVSHRVTIP